MKRKKKFLKISYKEHKGIEQLNVFQEPTLEERKIFDRTQQKVFFNCNVFSNIAQWKVQLVLQGYYMKEGNPLL